MIELKIIIHEMPNGALETLMDFSDLGPKNIETPTEISRAHGLGLVIQNHIKAGMKPNSHFVSGAGIKPLLDKRMQQLKSDAPPA